MHTITAPKVLMSIPVLLLLLLLLLVCLSTQQVVSSCPWDDTFDELLGAPTPEFTGTVKRSGDDYSVVLTVGMAKHNGTSPSADHFVTLMHTYDPCNDTERQDMYSVHGWQLLSDDDCHAVYQLERSLQEHIDDPNTVKQFDGGDFFTLKTQVYAAYTFTSTEADDVHCSSVHFTAPYTIDVFLYGDAHAAFESETDAIAMVRQNRIRILSGGELDVQLRIELLSTPARLSDFAFLGASPDASIVFRVEDVAERPAQCGLDGDRDKCVYTLNAVTNDAHADYSGKYTFSALHTNPVTGIELAGLRIWFSLQYAVPVPPPTTRLNVTTVAWLRDSIISEVSKNTFTTNEEVFVVQETVPSITVPGKTLAITQAFLCCMKDRQPYPQFELGDPDKPGCTQNDPEIMSVWSELINDSRPQDLDFDPKTHNVPFAHDKAGMSLQLLPLQSVAESKGSLLCYVHVKATFVDRDLKRHLSSMAGVTSSVFSVDNSDTIAVAPLQILPTATPPQDATPDTSDPDDDDNDNDNNQETNGVASLSAETTAFALSATLTILLLLHHHLHLHLPM